MTRVLRLGSYAVLVLAAIVLVACGMNPPADQDAIGSMTVAPAQWTIGVGETVQLTPTMHGVTGNPDRSVTWLSSAPSVATVGPTGLVTGVTEGDTAVTVRSVFDPSVTATAFIRVGEAVGECGPFGPWTDGFPVPVNNLTSPFPTVDDSFVEIAFGGGFTFPFYGVSYTRVFLNTNGGMTFIAGSTAFDPDVTIGDVPWPTIAPFWGDMRALWTAERANMLRWRQAPSCFQVAYQDYPDFSYPGTSWDNSAIVTLHDDGRIVIAYGVVDSLDVLIGVFDGSHVNDSVPDIGTSYDLSQLGTGVILYDWFGRLLLYDGALNGTTVTFVP
jgi:hypothetical protein